MGTTAGSTRRPSAPRWARRPEERPQEILDAALRVFAARGYAGTRLEEVAEAAGVTKGTIYHYFDNKEALLCRAVEQRHERLFGQLGEMLRDQGGPASARIRLLLRKVFGARDEAERGMLTLLIQGLAQQVPDVYRHWLLTGPAKGWQLLAGMIEEGKAAGEFRPDADSEVAARILVSGLMQQLIWHRCQGLAEAAPIDTDRLIDSAVELFLAGLRRTA